LLGDVSAAAGADEGVRAINVVARNKNLTMADDSRAEPTAPSAGLWPTPHRRSAFPVAAPVACIVMIERAWVRVIASSPTDGQNQPNREATTSVRLGMDPPALRNGSHAPFIRSRTCVEPEPEKDDEVAPEVPTSFATKGVGR